ncbi:MAG: ribose-phosphate diphosphokinase [Candidatus Nealsonbacteria bacterium]|nr:ribose-phosphate diphosphokinase [Candidatus Nealsonbacteria bacterium]
MKNFIIPTSSAEHLAKSILDRTKAFEIIFPDINKDKKRYFPDEEVYVRILKANKLKRNRVIVLYSGMPKPNQGLMELELILQILRDNNVKPEIFFTYFPYGMQDKVFKKGETNVAENLTEKLINYYQVKKIYIIDAHFWGRKWAKKYPVVNVSAVPILIEKVKKDFGQGILFLSPDLGGKRRTKISGMQKKRMDSFQVKITTSNINLKGRIIGVIDDMIKTGGTLLKFQEIAKKSGAKKIIALITHGVIPAGISKIKKKYSKLYLTNTICQKESNIDITDLILKTLLES